MTEDAEEEGEGEEEEEEEEGEEEAEEEEELEEESTLTLHLLFVADVLDEGRPAVQHGLVLHPVVVEEEERLLTFLFQ